MIPNLQTLYSLFTSNSSACFFDAFPALCSSRLLLSEDEERHESRGMVFISCFGYGCELHRSSESHGEQPLAPIAVYEMVFALDGRASIEASPSVLGLTVSL